MRIKVCFSLQQARELCFVHFTAGVKAIVSFCYYYYTVLESTVETKHDILANYIKKYYELTLTIEMERDSYGLVSCH